MEKKYFMKGTEDELQFGDVISVVLTKEEDGHTVHKKMECKFIPEMVDLLLSEDIIEQRGECVEATEGKEDLLDFEDIPCEALEELFQEYEEMEQRVEKLEERVEKFIDMHKDFVRLTSNMIDAFREFVLGLPEKDQNQRPKEK